MNVTRVEGAQLQLDYQQNKGRLLVTGYKSCEAFNKRLSTVVTGHCDAVGHCLVINGGEPCIKVWCAYATISLSLSLSGLNSL